MKFGLEIWISLGTKFQLKLKILTFGQTLSKKGIFLSKAENKEQHHWILHIPIALCAKFQFKLPILIVCIKFAQKEYFRSKIPLLNFAYSYWSRYQIAAWTHNFDILDEIIPKTVFPVENGKTQHHHWILHIRISLGNQILL